jgi:tol-pal system protein YbgF
MVSQVYRQRLSVALIALLALIVSACSTNPTREESTEDTYDQLYSGSSKEKTANEAAISAETPEEAVARGDEAFRKGQHDIALYEYVEALKLSGGDAETLNKVGDVHYTLGDMDNAAAAYNATLELEEDNQHALQGLGLTQLRTRDYEQAKINLGKALDVNPDLWHAHNGLGTIADIEGDHASAIEHYQDALRLSPRSPQILNNLGYSEYLSGNWHAAMMRFVQAVNADPRFDRAWYNIGLLYTRQGNYEDAFVAFRNVLDTPQAYNDIGYLCMIDGYYDVAEMYFDKAVKTSPSYYLKAHENIDRLERLRERNTAGYYRNRPNAAPEDRLRAATSDDTRVASTEIKTVALDESGKPVVTVAEPQGSVLVTSTPEGVAAASATVLTETLALVENKAEPTQPVTKTMGGFKSLETVAPTGQVSKSDETSATAVPIRPEQKSEPAPEPELVTIDALPASPPAEPVSETETKPESVAETAETGDSTQVAAATISTSGTVTTNPAEQASQPEQESAGTKARTTGISNDTKNEQSEYRKALALVRDGEFEAAAESFNVFLKEYPDSSYADNANYWIGETYYVTRDFNTALEVFTELVNAYPGSPKVPDTRLKIGYIHYEQNDWETAQDVLTSIVNDYPDTEVAQLANARLMRMEDEGH